METQVVIASHRYVVSFKALSEAPDTQWKNMLDRLQIAQKDLESAVGKAVPALPAEGQEACTCFITKGLPFILPWVRFEGHSHVKEIIQRTNGPWAWSSSTQVAYHLIRGPEWHLADHPLPTKKIRFSILGQPMDGSVVDEDFPVPPDSACAEGSTG